MGMIPFIFILTKGIIHCSWTIYYRRIFFIYILNERYPDTNFVRREKAGPYGEADPELWEEIKEEGDGAMVSTGH